MKCMQCGEYAAGSFCDVHRQPIAPQSFEAQSVDVEICDPYADTVDLVNEIEPQHLMWSGEE